MAKDKSIIKNSLLVEDQINVINALNGLGVKIEQKQNKVIIFGDDLTSDFKNKFGKDLKINFVNSIGERVKRFLGN